MAYVFEWNAHKAKENQRKHGVGFDEAKTAFGDPLNVLIENPDHLGREKQYLLLGQSSRGRLLVVAFVDRSIRTRLISARRATRRERKRYEEEG